MKSKDTLVADDGWMLVKWIRFQTRSLTKTPHISKDRLQETNCLFIKGNFLASFQKVKLGMITSPKFYAVERG